MRSPQRGTDTWTRILDAAIDRFGRDGFDASLRTVAADAGVSAAAIIKHFGTKEQLHSACDERVLEVVDVYKREAMQSADLRSTFLTQIALLDEFQPLMRYFVRSLLAGGDVARHLLTEMRSQAAQWMQDGVAAGNLKPSRDEELRVKYTFSASIGWLVQSVLDSGVELGELDSRFWRHTFQELMLPALEIYTEGLLTDRAMLDEYLLYVSDPPTADAPDDDAGGEGAPGTR